MCGIDDAYEAARDRWLDRTIELAVIISAAVAAGELDNALYMLRECREDGRTGGGLAGLAAEAKRYARSIGDERLARNLHEVEGDVAGPDDPDPDTTWVDPDDEGPGAA